MKKLYKYFYLITVALSVTACDLTLTPEDTMTPDTFFSSEKELELWTNQFYTLFDGADAAAGQNADDNIDRTLGDVITGTRSAADESGWSWSKLRTINYYLQNSARCKDEVARKKYDGVAYFFRAYFYFVKVRRYGDVPWYSQMLNSTDDALLNQPRDDRGFVMDKVIEDLDKAIEMLPSKKNISSVTRWTALALKSRAALYEGTYRKYHGLADADKYLQEAANAAEIFITESGYTLYQDGEEPYRELFNSIDAKQNEVITARIYSFDLGLPTGIQFNITNNQQGFTRRYINHYLMADGSRFTDRPEAETMFYTDEVKGRDPRLKQTVLCPGYIQKGEETVSPNTLLAMTGYQPIKFVAETKYDGAAKGSCDWPLFRTAEVYLNYAEAKGELGTLTQPDLDKSVNLIRKRAKMPFLDMVAANANPDPYMELCYPNVDKGANKGVILELRRERTIEMVMEGQRQWDLFRWKEGAQMVNSTQKYYGCYIPGPGLYDMDGDGKNDLEIYTETSATKLPAKKKIGVDIILSQGTSGYIEAWSTVNYTWDENRDYLWPIPADERVLTGGALTQNPGWFDGLDM